MSGILSSNWRRGWMLREAAPATERGQPPVASKRAAPLFVTRAPPIVKSCSPQSVPLTPRRGTQTEIRVEGTEGD